jgi:Lysozyme like domain
MLIIVVVIVGLGYYLLEDSSSASASTVGPSGSTGSTLGFSDIVSYARNAGFTEPDLDTAAAIALAESSGITNNVGDTSLASGPSYGLWQIHISAHPEYSASDMMDPQLNANAAFAIYSAAGGFSPWTTYTNGAYADHLPTVDASTTQTMDTEDDSM